MKNRILPICLILVLAVSLFPEDAPAFSRLKTGLETITTGYLIPISRLVAGASLVLFATLSFFKQDEYQRKIANIIFLAVIASCGLEVLDKLMKAFG